ERLSGSALSQKFKRESRDLVRGHRSTSVYWTRYCRRQELGGVDEEVCREEGCGGEEYWVASGAAGVTVLPAGAGTQKQIPRVAVAFAPAAPRNDKFVWVRDHFCGGLLKLMPFTSSSTSSSVPPMKVNDTAYPRTKRTSVA